MPFKAFPNQWDWDSIVEHMIINYRWMFVLFLLPISFLFDVWFYMRNRIIFALNSAPTSHAKKLRDIQKQIRKYHASGSQAGMCTARPGWQTVSPQNMNYKNKMFGIHLNLVDILEVDVERKVVRCEPLVTMGQLTHTLNALGWTIPVLPELDDLTVGGLVMGTGIETSSHKYGLFQHICRSYEIILADGSVETCDANSNPDLFYAIPWSYGTLGFLASVEIDIIPCKKYVELDYIPVKSQAEMIETFEAQIHQVEENDFVECLVFSQDTAVVMTGRMVDACDPNKLNRIGRWYKPWFFKHVINFLQAGPSKEYIPLRDYYHRHSRSIFWEIQDIIPFGNNIIFRILLGWLIPPKISLLKLTQGQTIKRLYETHHTIQDMLVPIADLKNALDVFHKEVEIYPIWLCPFKLPPNPGMLDVGSMSTDMYIDIGVYGVPTVPTYETVATTRRLEEYVRSVRGFQMLYADTYMSRDEFRGMFKHELYDRMRCKYVDSADRKVTAFPDVYEKVNKKARSG